MSNQVIADSPHQSLDDYVAWARYDNGTIRLCDSDSPGAFRVYRHPPTQAASWALMNVKALLEEIRDIASFHGLTQFVAIANQALAQIEHPPIREHLSLAIADGLANGSGYQCTSEDVNRAADAILARFTVISKGER
jgi:hypothetical protein